MLHASRGASHAPGDWVRRGLVFSLFAAATVVFASSIAYLSLASDYKAPEKVGINEASAGARILDRQGRLLFEYVDPDVGKRIPVRLDRISDHLTAATIVTEDASFFSNPGINYTGLGRALWENLNPFSGPPLRGSGGSSITQQLVKNVYFPPEERSNRSASRKAREIIYAFKVTEHYSKNQILNWYLNEISYGGVVSGAEAASQSYFSKPASDLTLAEAALLAGIPQAPSLYDPLLYPEKAVARRNQVLDLLAEHGKVEVREGVFYSPDPAEIEAAKAAPLELRPRPAFQVHAPHFVFTYLQPQLEELFGLEALYRDGLVITTSLDLDLQAAAEAALETWVAGFEEVSNTHNGAVVVLDPREGQILAMVGSRDYYSEEIEGKNNNLLALNSPGSALKPFVYLDLFLRFNAGPGNLIEDAPISFKNADGSTFTPRNPTGTYLGHVTVRNALGNSLNAAAFSAAQYVGVDEIVSFGRKVGLTSLDGSYGPSIAIGGVDVEALDLAYAYSTLANGGVLKGQRAIVEHEVGERRVDPVSLLRVARPDGEVLFDSSTALTEERVFPEDHAFLINSILSDPNAHCLTFGCGALSVPGLPVAVKTGTSEPFDPSGPNGGKIGETWAFGYTPDVVVGVWAGNADNSPIINIQSTSIALRVMRDVMLSFHGGKPSTPFVPTPGVARGRVCHTSPVRMCVDDFFLRSALVNLPQPDPATPGGPEANPAPSGSEQTRETGPETRSTPAEQSRPEQQRVESEQLKKQEEEQRKKLEEQRKKVEEQQKKQLEEQKKNQEKQRKGRD